ncbi:DUF2946 family protein [Sphaerotilus sp.]|uniref:DUF2946 family protein n=1 Tax=Sphaerotilus sp. TaxID=2093942 RepID=UPI002ACD4921|nr:DUF2946 family protein [Sphaerotilus sp.]MDZ7857947.1 DUF2946 family protein [Sphaerotilus sp.]
MDDIVKAALKKWPNVPDCRGWLALDARGDWYMRDDRTQAAGPFPLSKGSRILHDKLREFIGRNYEADADGCWFFQNGPQKVFVELEAAPWVFSVQRVDGRFQVETQTGRLVPSVDEVLVDENGRLFLHTPIGLGLVRSVDMDAAADAVLGGVWVPRDVLFAALPARCGHELSPQRHGRA